MSEPDRDDAPARRLRAAVRRLADQTSGRPRTGRTHHDADDVTGTAATDDAVGFDPLPLLRALDRSGARVVVIGQVAGIMHGSEELTGDLDLLWDGDPGQAGPMAAAFSQASAQLTNDDGAPVPCDPAAFRLPKILFRTATASGDCCTPALPWGNLPVADFLGRCETASTGDFTIRYLSRENLIQMRQAIGRPKDLRRARELVSLLSEERPLCHRGPFQPLGGVLWPTMIRESETAGLVGRLVGRRRGLAPTGAALRRVEGQLGGLWDSWGR